MTEAVLFDNDGVLVDTETLFFETTQRSFAELGLSLDRETWGQRFLTEGNSSRDIALSLGADADRATEIFEQRNQQFRRVLQNALPLRPQVRETVAALRGRYKLAIVTGCGRDHLELLHSRHDLLGCFDIIVTSDDCPHSKPHPGLYLTALRALGVDAERCIAIEDSPRGLAAAQAAGVRCMVVPTELTAVLKFPGALAIEQEISAVLSHL